MCSAIFFFFRIPSSSRNIENWGIARFFDWEYFFDSAEVITILFCVKGLNFKGADSDLALGLPKIFEKETLLRNFSAILGVLGCLLEYLVESLNLRLKV